MTCCSQFQASWDGDSPFLENIVLGYYDDPTTGLVRCHQCGQDYKYDLLAWDSGQDSRLFALGRPPSGSFDRIAKLLAIAGPPGYPDWVVLWSETLDEQWRPIDRALAEIDREATKAEYLLIGATPTGALRVRRIDDAIQEEIVQGRCRLIRLATSRTGTSTSRRDSPAPAGQVPRT